VHTQLLGYLLAGCLLLLLHCRAPLGRRGLVTAPPWQQLPPLAMQQPSEVAGGLLELLPLQGLRLGLAAAAHQVQLVCLLVLVLVVVVLVVLVLSLLSAAL
jgi:hypothetical protein